MKCVPYEMHISRPEYHDQLSTIIVSSTDEAYNVKCELSASTKKLTRLNFLK